MNEDDLPENIHDFTLHQLVKAGESLAHHPWAMAFRFEKS